MSSSSQQTPRGLPGFLRRTLRTSSEQEDALDFSPSTAPVSPGLFPTDDDDDTADVAVDEGAINKTRSETSDSSDLSSRSKSDSQVDVINKQQKDMSSATTQGGGGKKTFACGSISTSPI